MQEDILSEAPLYKSLIAQGKEEEREKQRRSLRNTLIEIFDENFPQLSALAQEKLPTISDPDMVQKLLVRVARAQNEKGAKTSLLQAARPKGM